MQSQSISSSAPGRKSRRIAWIALVLCAVAAVAIIAVAAQDQASPSNDETELFFRKIAKALKKQAKGLSKGQEARNLKYAEEAQAVKDEAESKAQASAMEGLKGPEKALALSMQALQEHQKRMEVKLDEVLSLLGKEKKAPVISPGPYSGGYSY